MGKLANAFIMSAVIQISLILFDTQGINFTPIINLFINPMSVSGSAYWLSFLTTSLTVAGLGAIFIGTFVIKLDWLVRLGMFTTLFDWVIFPYLGLWNAIASKITQYGGGCKVGDAVCSVLPVSGFGAIIAGLVVGPMIFFSLWATTEWIWGGDR